MTTFSHFESHPEIEWADPATCLALFRETEDSVRPLKYEETTRIWSVTPPDGRKLFLKSYRVPWRRRLFAGAVRSRALREWRALRAMEAAGLPVPTPVWFAESRRRGQLRFSIVATHSLDPVKRLADSLRSAPAAEVSICRAVGAVTRRLHDAGFGHFRLRPKNLLVGPPPDFPVHVLDLPYTCHWSAGAPPRIRQMDLEQLAGAYSKLSRTAVDAILCGYHDVPANANPPDGFRPGSRSRWGQKLRRIVYFVHASGSGHVPEPRPELRRSRATG